MRIIITQKANQRIKLSYESVDDQPNFVDRNKTDQDAIWNKEQAPDSIEDIEKRFKKRKKKRNFSCQKKSVYP